MTAMRAQFAELVSSAMRIRNDSPTAATAASAKRAAAAAACAGSRAAGNQRGARLTTRPLAPKPSMASDTTMNERW